jgi:hypothetical protein
MRAALTPVVRSDVECVQFIGYRAGTHVTRRLQQSKARRFVNEAKQRESLAAWEFELVRHTTSSAVKRRSH